jgi:hypothetical protein
MNADRAVLATGSDELGSQDLTIRIMLSASAAGIPDGRRLANMSTPHNPTYGAPMLASTPWTISACMRSNDFGQMTPLAHAGEPSCNNGEHGGTRSTMARRRTSDDYGSSEGRMRRVTLHGEPPVGANGTVSHVVEDPLIAVR